MLERFFLRAVPLVPLLLLAPGCDGETSSTPATTTTTDPCLEASPDDDGLPKPLEGAPPGDGPERLFAVSRFHIGNRTLDGLPDAGAWKGYGFNLDRTTTGPDTGYCTCRPAAGARWRALNDGLDGRDNSFGWTLLPLLESLSSDLEEKANASVKEGRYSWLFRLQGIGDGAASSGLSAELFEAAPYVPPEDGNLFPPLDGTAVWPVLDVGLTSTDPPAAGLTFEDAFLAPGDDGGSVWVGRGKGTIRLWLPVEAEQFRVVIHDPVLVLPFTAGASGISRGMLGGQLDIEEVVAEAGRLLGFIEYDGKKLCPPSATFESIAQQIRQGADSLAGFALDTTVPCDRASIGIAFDAAPIAALGPVVEAPPIVDPCAGE